MLEKYSASAPGGRRPPRVAPLLLAVALGLLATSFLLPSCTRKPKNGASAPATPTPAGVPANKQGEARQSDQANGPKQGSDAPPASASAANLAAALRGFGLGVPSIPRMPEDFSLGPLQSYGPAEGAEAAVFAVARKFMDGIAAGKLDEQLLLPEAREALAVLLSPPQSKASGEAASPYRLGAVTIKGDDASLALRMPRMESGSARVEGLLSLRKSGDAWYIQALALKPPESAALAFMPDASDSAAK
jgi:hypothetical protein